MHFHQDTPGILLVEGDRLHMGADLAPLFSPVSADCFRPVDEAAFESSRPLYIGSHEDERGVNVPRVESRIGGAEQFGFWCRLVWHKEERVLARFCCRRLGQRGHFPQNKHYYFADTTLALK